MVDWEKVVIPGVPESHIGTDGGILCAEVDSYQLLEEQRRAHPIRSVLKTLRRRPDQPDRHILKVWRRAREGDYTVAQLVYSSGGELQSVRHDRLYANDDIGAGSPAEILSPRPQQQLIDEIRSFFANAPGAAKLIAQISDLQRTIV
jgi:hypothetical protein